MESESRVSTQSPAVATFARLVEAVEAGRYDEAGRLRSALYRDGWVISPRPVRGGPAIAAPVPRTLPPKPAAEFARPPAGPGPLPVLGGG